jgi:phage FluMu protein Com
MSLKEIALVGLLIVIIVLAALFTVKWTRSETPATAMSFTDLKEDRIDMKSLEVITETIGDWQSKYAPDASGRYKNPKTGEFTMVEIMKCAWCGQLIPVAQLPPELIIKTPPGKRGSMPGRNVLKKIADFQLNYKCPRCGHPALTAKSSETKPPETKSPETKPAESTTPAPT